MGSFLFLVQYKMNVAVEIMMTMPAISAIKVVGVSVDVDGFGEEVFETEGEDVGCCVFWDVADGLGEALGVGEGDAEVLVVGEELGEALVVGEGEGEGDGSRSEVGLNAKEFDSAVRL